MWGVEFPSDEPFVYSVMGVQYEGDAPSDEATQSRIQQLDAVLTASSATHTDPLVENGHGPLAGWTSRLWLSYWATARDYDAWWHSPAVAAFWRALPADAGVYREVLRVSPRRTQLGTNKERPSGLGHLGRLTPLGDKTMYWGCYRDRYQDASRENRLGSSLDDDDALSALRRPRTTTTTTTSPSSATPTIRPGRTRITSFPDNLCFVVEGQDHGAISPEERTHWFEHFDGLVTTWMQDLLDAGPEQGVLDAKICYAAPEDPSSSTSSSSSSSSSPPYRHDPRVPALNHNKKVQLFWFLDHRHMEKIGRANKGHVALRNSFIQSYCPAGPMGVNGQLLLWVETSVVKADEIEAEYVGVVEGTGFLAYDHHPAFQSTQTT